MLDNGYVYLAATRLVAYCSAADWGLTIEVFGFSPHAGFPDTCIHTFGSSVINRRPAREFVTPEAYANYLRQNPHNGERSVYPIEAGDWQDPDDTEFVNKGDRRLLLRGKSIPVPTLADCRRLGIEPQSSPQLQVFECCRAIAATHREFVLATPEERSLMLPAGMQPILQLDAWHHPDLARGDCPSKSETFQQLARVLATGIAGFYRPTLAPNTHWTHWPAGGCL